MNTPILRTALLAAAVASLAACATKNTNTGEANDNNPRTEASARLTTAAGGAPVGSSPALRITKALPRPACGQSDCSAATASV